jgi:hypothetical protein
VVPNGFLKLPKNLLFQFECGKLSNSVGLNALWRHFAAFDVEKSRTMTQGSMCILRTTWAKSKFNFYWSSLKCTPSRSWSKLGRSLTYFFLRRSKFGCFKIRSFNLDSTSYGQLNYVCASWVIPSALPQSKQKVLPTTILRTTTGLSSLVTRSLTFIQ